MAARTEQAKNETTDAADAAYDAALRAVVAGTSGGLNPTALAVLAPLNAVFYLRDYLPANEHAAVVASAARRLISEVSTPNAEPAAVQPWRGRRRPSITALARLAGTRTDTSRAVTLLQHLLELEPRLDHRSVRGLRLTAHSLLLGMPAAPERIAWASSAARGGLNAWAAGNARPPRDGETARWAGCLGQPPLEPARQALAGGLRFAALVDALSVAAALRLHARPNADEATGLIAAHAVRRLAEIGGAPALAAWLGVAAELSPTPDRGLLKAREPAPEPRALALAAVRSGEALLIQAAEAALMEAEALPPELRHVPLSALAALLRAHRAMAAEPGSAQLHAAHEECAAATAAAGGIR
ncbi:MAG TPA: hypothetical protein VKV26_03355 [Dehalococcoidia bacterium]|nr:hypothetical protein [Dehalococcoidia bacterium]